MSDPIRVFCGTEPKTRIAEKVLHHSILRHTKSEIEFVPMIGPEWEYPIDGITVGTGFSLRRWMIPRACDWKGRAIYLDADQLVFSDIQQLWDVGDTMGEDVSTAQTYQTDKYSKKPWPQSSVMVINCDVASDEWGWRIEEVLAHLRATPTRTVYADFMHMVAVKDDRRQWWTQVPPDRLGVEWNSLNIYASGKTKLTHFTKEPEQPWYEPNHPISGVWTQALIEALEIGFVTRADMEEALDKWGKKEDWRQKNGLNPFFKKFLPIAVR